MSTQFCNNNMHFMNIIHDFLFKRIYWYLLFEFALLEKSQKRPLTMKLYPNSNTISILLPNGYLVKGALISILYLLNILCVLSFIIKASFGNICSFGRKRHFTMKIHVIFSNIHNDKDMVYLPITQKYSTSTNKLMTERTKMAQGLCLHKKPF